MIRAPRVPRPSRPILLTILVTALLALPMGIVLASHQFSDVPNSNPFHADIDALVDAGVTAGCGGGRYCPKANVTREQMAAFLNRLGALSPGETPVVNADKIDGINSSSLMQFGANAGSGGLMRGTFSTAGDAAGLAGTWNMTAIVWPVPLASAPVGHIIPTGGPVPAGCSGSVSAPAASPGHLCLFVGGSSNISTQVLCNPITDVCGGPSRFGVGLEAFSAADGQWWTQGTWAVRAPLTAASESGEEVTGPAPAVAP